MASRWHHKYEAEAARLATLLRRWYALETEVRRLEWTLNRCRHPRAASPPAPPPVEKPTLLRRAEANKPLTSEQKQGRLRSWKDRYQELHASREHYEDDNRRLADQAQRLTMLLAECAGAEGQKPHGTAGDEEAARIDRARHALRVEQVSETAQAPEEREEETAPPSELDLARRRLRRLQGRHRALQQEKEAAERRAGALQRQVDILGERLARTEQALTDKQEVLAELERRQARAEKTFEALETVRELARRFLQGQRSFLFLHNDPQLENALAGLIDYSLARLAASMAAGDDEGILALCANLDAVATRLQTYNGAPVHGFDTARALLPPLRDQAEAGDACLPPASTERQGPEAKPFLVRLKYLRDVARLDLRPFYWLDDQNRVHRIG